MLSKWFQDCKTEEERKKRKELININKPTLDILRKICYNSILELDKSSSDYTTPNWDYRQADLNGQRKALQDIIKMCNIDKESIDHNG